MKNRPSDSTQTDPSSITHERPRGIAESWFRVPLVTALAGATLLWMAYPPLNVWPLAWVAPLPWLRLIQYSHLPCNRPFVTLYFAGLIHWLLMVQWVRLPHWSAYFGWLALAMYLAVYVPLFIGLTRTAVHRLGCSIVIAAPITWVGLEAFRGFFLTGFSIGLLGHTQVQWVTLIQIADLGGAYAVGFVVMLVAACVSRAIGYQGNNVARWPLAVASVSIAVVLAYGYARLAVLGEQTAEEPRINVALIQGSIDTEFGVPDSQIEKTFNEYMGLTRLAVSKYPDLDLVVWPESMFASIWPLVTFNSDITPPTDSELTAEQYRGIVAHMADQFSAKSKAATTVLGTPILAGTEAIKFDGQSQERFNSAVFIERDGHVSARYDKMHPVMFGEYVPFGDLFPWLYQLTPMHGGLTPGRAPTIIDVGGIRLSPSICFENTVPHLIRKQVRQLTQQGSAPDALVTLTNDGWFWGSSLLDLHLTCGVFRAIENRLPALIAANTGFSSWIDNTGQIKTKGARRKNDIVIAYVNPSRTSSPYRLIGDVPAGGCLIVCAALFGIQLLTTIQHKRNRHARPVDSMQ